MKSPTTMSKSQVQRLLAPSKGGRSGVSNLTMSPKPDTKLRWPSQFWEEKQLQLSPTRMWKQVGLYFIFVLHFIILILVPCEFGYAPICNSSKSSDEKTAICPAENFVKSHFFWIQNHLFSFDSRSLWCPRILFAAASPSRWSLWTSMREEILLEEMISASKWIRTFYPTVQSMVRFVKFITLRSHDIFSH